MAIILHLTSVHGNAVAILASEISFVIDESVNVQVWRKGDDNYLVVKESYHTILRMWGEALQHMDKAA